MELSTIATLALVSLLVFVGMLIGTCVSKLGLMICVCGPTVFFVGLMLVACATDENGVSLTIGFAAAGGSLL